MERPGFVDHCLGQIEPAIVYLVAGCPEVIEQGSIATSQIDETIFAAPVAELEELFEPLDLSLAGIPVHSLRSGAVGRDLACVVVADLLLNVGRRHARGSLWRYRSASGPV
jgi:hypothetical protein